MSDYLIPSIEFGRPTAAAKSPIRDAMLEEVPAGAVRFAFDLDFSWCYPGGPWISRGPQLAPVRNQAVYDLCERADGYSANASYFEAVTAGYAGGGFDFGSTDPTELRNPYGVAGPTDAWNPIHASPNAYFMVVAYYKMPTAANWNPSNGFAQMFSSQTSNGFYSDPEPLSFAQIQGNLAATRQRNAVGILRDTLTLTPTAAHFGKMCQVAYWRNADGQGFRMKSADGEVSTSLPVNAENVSDYTGLAPVWGDARTSANGPLNADVKKALKFREYRGWLENLAASGRDPLTVLNNDWTRVQSRIAASAAANGGTSLIFV